MCKHQNIKLNTNTDDSHFYIYIFLYTCSYQLSTLHVFVTIIISVGLILGDLSDTSLLVHVAYMY